MLIGGDDSVVWSHTHADKVELVEDKPKGKLHQTHPKKHAVNVVKSDGFVEGRDPTNTDGKVFTISIELPKNRPDDWRNAVVLAAQNPVGNRIAFTLDIEGGNYDQISVDWPSAKGTSV